MSSNFNLLKSMWVSINPEDKRIINSDERIAEKMSRSGKEGKRAPAVREDDPEDPEDGFSGGLFAEQVDGLFEDMDERVIKADDDGAGRARDEEMRQELIKQAEDDLALAQVKINQMYEDARADMEVMKRVAAEEARGQGYSDGFDKGVGEIEKLRAGLQEDRKKLQMEYDRLVDELEPKFVELITGIYEQIIHVELKEYGPIVAHLIANTMRNSEENKDFIIHVSKADYEYVSGHKEDIKTEAVSGMATVEIIEDITLSPGDCMIETGGGVFDCSLGTQLAGLNEKLRLLSFEK